MMGRVAAVVAATFLVAGVAQAGDWRADHPRRAQVNNRLNRQNRRIDEGVKSGRLSHGQAKQLHEEDHAMRQQERSEAAEHGGHITKREQRQLNREENGSSRQIYDEKH
jgi:hypothetical protein